MIATSGAGTARLPPYVPAFREAIVVAHRPLSLNPLLTGGDPAVTDVGRLLYPALLRLDDRAQPVADLAASWAVSGDGLTYRAALPAGRRWSDGTALTTDDVLATVALAQSVGLPDGALAGMWQGVTSTASAGSVAFTLTAPRSSFPVSLAALPILPARQIRHHSAADLRRTASTPMPTSGLYRVADSSAAALRLTANPHSPETPSLADVEVRLSAGFDAALQLFQQGQVDAIAAVTSEQRRRVSHVDHVHLHDTLTFDYTDLLFNQRVAALQDVAVRTVIAGAIHRRPLIAGELSGAAVPQRGAIPAGVLWMSSATAPAEDPAPAAEQSALDAAGWLVAPDGVRAKGTARLEFALSVPATSPLPGVAAAIAQQLRVLGILCHLEQVPTDQFAQRVLTPHAFDLALVRWQTSGDPDVSSFWRSSALPPQGVNVSGAAPDPFLDQALDTLSMLGDPQLRRAAAARVDSQLTDGAAAVFLYAPTVTFATDDAFATIAVPPTGGRSARHADMARWTPRPH